MQNLQSLALNKIILIGASSGGPSLIQKIILSIDNLNDTAIVIAQHMAEGFIDSFANELNKISKHDISVVENDLTILPKHIYLCKHHSTIKQDGNNLKFCYNNIPTKFNPEINTIFKSFKPFADE